MTSNGIRREELFSAVTRTSALVLVLLFASGELPRVFSNERKEGVRAQLASLQAETGLTLSGFPSNYLLRVDFASRDVSIETTSMPASRTAEGALSPDGAEVAFRWADPSLPVPEDEILAIARHDGTGMREYPKIRILKTPCWAPDKSRIAVFANVTKPGERYREGLVLLDLSSGAVEEITPGGFVSPECWSPDGKQIVYSAREPQGPREADQPHKNWREVYTRVGIYDVARKNWREIAHGNEPAWSPDGGWIAFLDGNHYYAIRPSGVERKPLLQAKDLWGGLAWSPDSRFVAYAVSHVDFMNPSRVSRIRVRRLVDGSDDWVADKLTLGIYLRWIRVGSGNSTRPKD
jgi:Tol biopolymer transport system component